MILYILEQGALAIFNLINSRIDAYRILKHKEIAHAINLCAYAILVGVLIFILKMNLPNAIVFCFSAFFQRQLTFDIPLNLRRGLKWYYQSTANPPKACWDRAERALFPHNDGKKIVEFYALMWGVMIGFKIALWV